LVGNINLKIFKQKAMNKTVLITIAIIVGLLALWLIVLLVYPTKEEGTQEPVNVPTNEEQVLQPSGGVSQSVVATVEIVSDVSQVNASAVNAQVTIQ
jgi:hypothetical protein